jgi:hypothetical protein
LNGVKDFSDTFFTIMPKAISVSSIALLCLLASVGCNTPSDPAAQGKHSGSPTQSSSTPVPQQGNSQNFQTDPGNEKRGSQDKPVWVALPDKTKLDWFAYWANICLAGVGIFGIAAALCTLIFVKRQTIEMRRQRVVMGRTLLSIRRQANLMEEQTSILRGSVEAAQKSADAAKISAEAAKENVELIVNKERGRIFIELDKFDINDAPLNTQTVTFNVIYHGETVSFHESSSELFVLTTSQEPPSITIGGLLSFRSISELPQVIPASSEIFSCTARLYKKFDEFELNQISHGQAFIHFVGGIHYKDFMDRDHITAFSYTWHPRKPGTGLSFPHWQKSGKPEANRET